MLSVIGETLSEIAKTLGLPQRTVERRVQRKGIKPLTKEALYPVGTLDKIKNVGGPGRPRKTQKDESNK